MIPRGNIGEMCDKSILLNKDCSVTLFCKIYVCHGKDGAESLKIILVSGTGTICRLVVDKYQIRGSVLDS